MKLLKKLGALLLTISLSIFIGINSISASSITFKSTCSSSKVVVGKSFTVTVKISSENVLGSWEYSIDYNSSILSLTSGERSVATYGNGSQKSVSYKYTFKAIKAGSSTIGVKSYGAFDWDETKMSASASGCTVKVITQAQLEASYSKDNNLSSLSVENYNINPAFSKDISDYIVTLDPGVTKIKINATKSNKYASVVGTGEFDVIEGENKFVITVTAENGSVKTYNLVANVIDPNPIKVKTIDGKELTIVKRSSVISIPTNYSETKIKINDQEVPAFTNETNGFTLVGLKNELGEINLYIYNNKKNTFTKYSEIKLNNLLLYPTDPDDKEVYGYKKTKIKIAENEITAYKYKEKSNFAIIQATDLETGTNNYYMYDIKNNTAIIYNLEEVSDLKETINSYYKIILLLSAESSILLVLLLSILIKKIAKKKKKLAIQEKNSNTNQNNKSIIQEKEKKKKFKKFKKKKKNEFDF